MLALRLKSLQFFARTFSQKANKYKQLDTNLGNNLNQIPVLPAGTNPKAASLSLMQKLKLSPVPSTSALVTPQSPTSASTQNEQKDRLAKYHKIGP